MQILTKLGCPAPLIIGLLTFITGKHQNLQVACVQANFTESRAVRPKVPMRLSKPKAMSPRPRVGPCSMTGLSVLSLFRSKKTIGQMLKAQAQSQKAQ